jgi:hypothetical protein
LRGGKSILALDDIDHELLSLLRRDAGRTLSRSRSPHA